jgi:CheY-like chemotaxis protein
MSGLDATREIRRYEALQTIPTQYIIALTANARPEQIELCLTVGMDDVMVRGIDSRSKDVD